MISTPDKDTGQGYLARFLVGNNEAKDTLHSGSRLVNSDGCANLHKQTIFQTNEHVH